MIAVRLAFWRTLVGAGHRFTLWAEDHRAAAWRDQSRVRCNPCRLDLAVLRWEARLFVRGGNHAD